MAKGWNVISVMALSVFVYGTLKPGGRYHQQYCGQYAPEIVSALTRGRLYDFPHLGYPAMTAGEGWVKGYLFHFFQPANITQQILHGLDLLEGYRPQLTRDEGELNQEDTDYDRVRAEIFSCDCSFLQVAWIYRMSKRSVEAQGGVLIPNGDWAVR